MPKTNNILYWYKLAFLQRQLCWRKKGPRRKAAQHPHA